MLSAKRNQNKDRNRKQRKINQFHARVLSCTNRQTLKQMRIIVQSFLRNLKEV